MKMISQNEQGLSVEIVSQLTREEEKSFTILGGDSSNPSWEDYIKDWEVEYHAHLLLIRQLIKEHGLLGYTGQDAKDFYFKFSDGEIWAYTWRGWGDLMQAIVDKNEGYMAYYM